MIESTFTIPSFAVNRSYSLQSPPSYPIFSRRYLQEYASLGTAGSIYHFRDQITSGNPEAFFVLNADICADFPLVDMVAFHKNIVATRATSNTDDDNLGVTTILGTEATPAQVRGTSSEGIVRANDTARDLIRPQSQN